MPGKLRSHDIDEIFPMSRRHPGSKDNFVNFANHNYYDRVWAANRLARLLRKAGWEAAASRGSVLTPAPATTIRKINE